jgi:hypothetical protein
MTVELFKGQDYRLILATGISLTGATAIKILYKKPNGTKGEWSGTVDVQNIFYDITPANNDVEGVWTFQCYVEQSGKIYYGGEVTIEILNNLK